MNKWGGFSGERARQGKTQQMFLLKPCKRWSDSAKHANRLKLLGIIYLIGKSKLLFHGPLAE